MSVATDENRAPNLGGISKMGKSKTIEQIYTKKTQLEHILLRPDTYVGSIEKQQMNMWVLDALTGKIIQRPTTFVPGLYKIFDEIIVNAADNKQRDAKMNKMEVTIDPENNTIRVWNNGNGIPVVMHQEHKIYVPELIFGHLLTGSNFDDEEQKTTGGRNGYGAKLANIFSSEFVVETMDSARGLSFKQTFHNNMSNRSEPVIKKASGTDFTCITFKPDLRRFKMDCLDEDIVALLSKRVYDVAGTNCSGSSKFAVYLNGKRIEVRSLEGYIDMFTGLEKPCAFARVDERWEIGIGASDGSFQQVSYVNSICTIKGGQHVNYIADQVVQRLAVVLKKKNKGVEIKPNQIKNHLAIYVNALIVNPAFDSQTKENLTTKSASFGSTCVVPDKMLKEVEKSSIIDKILDWAKFKQNAELKRKGGSKQTRVLGITKLDDANYAGTAKSANCTLILTEGDSAKALAISGLGVVGRDYYGVFPLKGKLLNVREASHQQMMKNEEIQNIAKILGLTFGKVYENSTSLRYGHLMIMTDQDHDGSHIKGLLINFIHHFWPSLLQVPGFLQQFITPIVKCTKGKNEEVFFTIPEYLTWKSDKNDGKGWKIKYYKGLGTSTSAEAKEYFSHLETHEINFAWDERAGDQIDMAFSKKRVDERKQWLLSMQPGCFIDYNVDSITYDDFINHELILFSHADNERSIPHFMDGFKPSHRKVLFACFKRNLKQEIKVAQLAGYISEHSAYHHGEASLTMTVIGMAQTFVGSNNINLLSPCGQFGTRLMGGKDAASPRYVFTKLENITRCIFHPHDDPLLNYLDDDGQSIEPSYYVPIIPMVLVNGSEGIGTGWSTSVPTYNPRDIISNLRRMITGELAEHMVPWYRGFTGDIIAKAGSGNYIVSGKVEQLDESTILISELPIGKWTTDYKQMLESMIIGSAPASKEDGAAPTPQIVKSFKENHTDTNVLFTVVIPPEKLAEIVAEKGGLQKRFKLDSSIATSNMHMFDLDNHIRKFESVKEIMDAYFDVRLSFYDKRKTYLMQKLTDEWDKLDNKVRFILAVVTGKLIVSNRKKSELLLELKKCGYKTFTAAKKPVDPSEPSSGEELSDDDAEGTPSAGLDKGYDYLLSMKLWSLTLEKVQSLTAERDSKHRELDELQGKSAEDLWLNDLDQLETALDEFEVCIEDSKKQEQVAQRRANNASKKPKGKVIQKAKAKAHGSDDDGDDLSDSGDESDFDEKPKKKAVPVKKPVVAKAAPPVKTTSAPLKEKAATAPVTVTAPLVVVKSKPKPKVTRVKDSDDDEDDDSEESETEESDESDFEEEPKKKAAAPVKKPAVAAMTSKAAVIAPATASVVKAVSSKPKPKAAKKRDSDDEDDLEDSDESFAEEAKPQKKAPAKKPAVAQPVASVPVPAKVIPAAKAAKSKPTASVSLSKPATVSEVITLDISDSETGGSPKKRKSPSKDIGLLARLQERLKAQSAEKGVKAQKSVFKYASDTGDEMPKPVKAAALPKKALTLTSVKETTAATAGVKRTKKAALSPEPADAKKKPRKSESAEKVSKPVVAKKVVHRVEDSDDDEAPSAAPLVASKPARARKPQNYAAYFDEVEEEEEDEVSGDDDDSDFD